MDHAARVAPAGPASLRPLGAAAALALLFLTALLVPLPRIGLGVDPFLHAEVASRFPGWTIDMSPAWEDGYAVTVTCRDEVIGFLLHQRFGYWLVLIPATLASHHRLKPGAHFSEESHMFLWEPGVVLEPLVCLDEGGAQ